MGCGHGHEAIDELWRVPGTAGLQAAGCVRPSPQAPRKHTPLSSGDHPVQSPQNPASVHVTQETGSETDVQMLALTWVHSGMMGPIYMIHLDC